MLLAPVSLALVATIVLAAAVTASSALENSLLRKPSGQALRFVIAAATDVDGDRFGIVGRVADPDPWNASVYPYAPEIPGNGIDEDGVGGDLPAGPGYVEPSPPAEEWRRRPDVVLIVLESFRADLIGARYQGKPITPVMNALAERGASSRAAYSHNGYTVQSRFHLLAGSFIARRHAPTLVDDFNTNGYVTGYFSGQDESFGAEEYGVGFARADRSYDARSDEARRYSTYSTPGSLAVAHRAVQEHIEKFVDGQGRDAAPLFLYVSFEDTHFPYSHEGIETLVSGVRLPRSRIGPDERDALWATYANTAANVDRAVGEVVDHVRRVRGREPAVIITADHGESLFEGGFLGHGYGLDDAQTRVPLIVTGLPMRIREPFGQVDLRQALLSALSVPPEVAAAPVVEAAGEPLFQYLGDVRSPSQIGFVWPDGRLVYDFRRRRVQIGGGTWRPPSELTSSERERFLRLIHQWEWMNIARRRGQSDAE
jgi:arylsulfatase A-like enzyme